MPLHFICLTILLLVGTFISNPTYGIPEGPGFSKRYLDQVTPILSKSQTGMFTGENNLPIAYSVLMGHPESPAIVIVPGFTESYLGYGEIIADLNAKGYSTYILDHRGMGLSGREVENHQIVHVESFDDYVKDLETFVEEIVLPQKHSKLFMLSHSTGGLIGSHLLADHPAWFAKAAFSAPLFSPNTGMVPHWLAFAMAKGAAFLGLEKSYVFGRQDAQLSELSPKEAPTTKSLDRRKFQIEGWVQEPKTLQGGPSNQWLLEILNATELSAKLAPRVQTPILILQAEDEQFVENEAQSEFCSLAPNCELVPIANSRHELFREVDRVRDQVLKRLFDFFSD